MSTKATYFSNALVEATDGHHNAPVAAVDRDCPEEVRVEKAIETATAVTERLDQQLLQEVCEGSKNALARLFQSYARPVRNVAYRILRDESEADDLVQEVFIYLFEKASLYDAGKGSASSWIIQIAYHRALNRRQYLNTRQHYNAVGLQEVPLSVGVQPLFVNAVLAKTLLDRLRDEITPEQQQTLEFHLFEGYTFKEIAEKTGESVGNVRNHYYRGLERLRSCIFPKKGL